MKKANDKIPADEMLLAEAIAAAKANNLKWVSGSPFVGNDGYACSVYPGKNDTKCACAVGAVAIAKGLRKGEDAYAKFFREIEEKLKLTAGHVYSGNDNEGVAYFGKDRGEALGRAFRYAMSEG